MATPAHQEPWHVLHRLSRVRSDWGLAAVVDTETTGLDPRRHEVLELGLVLFAFDRRTGQVQGVVDEYTGLREPRGPILAAAKRVHGITEEEVRGRRLDVVHINSILSRAEFLVSHNAAFDRGFLSRLIPDVHRKPWLCSMSGVAWYARGHASRALTALLRDHGVFLDDAHRALDDARGTLVLLSLVGPTGATNLSELLRRNRGSRVRRALGREGSS